MPGASTTRFSSSNLLAYSGLNSSGFFIGAGPVKCVLGTSPPPGPFP